MSVKPDWWIKEMAEGCDMISPFEPKLISKMHERSIVSYGLASAAYDARLGKEFIFYNENSKALDPMRVEEHETSTVHTFILELAPGAFVLATTVEFFKIPRNIVATVAEKSTYKRCGISVGNTRLEPEWYGQITLEIRNDNPNRPVLLRAHEGIVAIEFHELLHGHRGPDISYADRKGKYQGQVGVTLPKGIA